MPISWDSLGTTVGINVGVAVAVFFIFNYLRRIPVVADYYAAKRKLSLPFRCASSEGCVLSCVHVNSYDVNAPASACSVQ